MRILRKSQLKTKDRPFILKAQNKEAKIIRTYTGETKTDCMYKFDRWNHRKGFKFFMIELKGNVYNINSLPRDYPYQEHHLE